MTNQELINDLLTSYSSDRVRQNVKEYMIHQKDPEFTVRLNAALEYALTVLNNG